MIHCLMVEEILPSELLSLQKKKERKKCSLQIEFPYGSVSCKSLVVCRSRDFAFRVYCRGKGKERGLKKTGKRVMTPGPSSGGRTKSSKLASASDPTFPRGYHEFPSTLPVIPFPSHPHLQTYHPRLHRVQLVLEEDTGCTAFVTAALHTAHIGLIVHGTVLSNISVLLVQFRGLFPCLRE